MKLTVELPNKAIRRSAVLVLVLGLATCQRAEQKDGAPSGAAARYVGGKSCAGCHAKEYEAWRKSQHHDAMAQASDRSVLGNFNNAKFTYVGLTSTFSKRDGKFFVNTEGRDGKLADYEIKY
ncbi:MAG TPA: multiheme c-type cytochrome, partial [Candidatus Binatia bacterium]